MAALADFAFMLAPENPTTTQHCFGEVWWGMLAHICWGAPSSSLFAPGDGSILLDVRSWAFAHMREYAGRGVALRKPTACGAATLCEPSERIASVLYVCSIIVIVSYRHHCYIQFISFWLGFVGADLL